MARNITIASRVDLGTKAKLESLAEASGLSKSEVIRALVDQAQVRIERRVILASPAPVPAGPLPVRPEDGPA